MPTKKRSTTKRAPAPVHSRLLSPETITRRELPNGLVVLVYENHTAPSVVVDADLRVGQLWEPADKNGLADFTTTALLRGTEKRTFNEIYEAIETVGASLSFGGGTHTSGFYGKSLAEDLPLLLELAADALRCPTFPAEQVERLRAERLTRFAIEANDTHSRAEEAFYEAAYPNHPYALNEDGKPETVRTFTLAEMAEFHRHNYGPRGMTVTIVGAVSTPQVLAWVEKYFGDWQNPSQRPEPSLPPLAPLTASVRRNIALPGKAQCDVMLGGPGPSRAHPGFLAARLGNSILGMFGMGGRVGHQVREKGGMAYYAGTGLDGGLGPGPWYAYAGVNPKNVDRAIELTLAEIRKFTTRKVTEQELADNKAFFIGRLPFAFETNEGLASSISLMELHQLGLDYFLRYPTLIEQLTREDIIEVAREFLHPDRCAIAVAG